MLANWNFQKFKIWAILYFRLAPGRYLPIGLDLTSVEMTYKINEIPSAQMQVAVGRQTMTLLAANIHHIVDMLQVSMPVQIWMQAVDLANSVGFNVAPWPAEPFVIFEGMTTGVGIIKSRDGKMVISISASHWLSNLNFSSALSRSSHRSNPSHFYSTAGMALGAGATGNPAWVSQGLGASFFTGDVIDTDIWSGGGPGAGLLQFLVRICWQDSFFAPEIGKLPGQDLNIEALDALMRFEPWISTPLNSQNWVYRFGVPLALRREQFVNFVDLDSAISHDIIREVFLDQHQTTIWDKLQSLKSDFLFAVVPMVDRALVVPALAGLVFHWQTIFAEDYESIRLTGELPRAVRGVALLLHGPMSEAGGYGHNPGTGQLGTPKIGAYYENPRMREGMIVMKRGPSWLSIAQPSESNVVDSTQPYDVIANAINPGVGLPPTAVNPVIAQKLVSGVAAEYARALYVEEALRWRTGIITGRPRFDIAPGSIVRFVYSADKFVSGQVPGGIADQSLMMGMVIGITLSFDAMEGRCGSNILLGHIRTQWEHLDPSYSVAFHPIWRFAWTGAPLHPHPAFIPGYNPIFGRA